MKQRSLGALIGLNIITCGIYSIVFFLKFGEDLNKLCDGDGETTQSYVIPWLLATFTLGIYPMIWMYKLGERMQKNAPRYGLTFEKGGKSFLLWFIFGACIIVGPFIALNMYIKNINALVTAYEKLSGAQNA